MTNLYYTILIKAILKPEAVKEYTQVLRSWKFPPGWNRLQSPAHHLASYSLSEHARWSVIVPGLRNTWLKPKHIKIRFWNAAAARPELDCLDLVDWLVVAFAGLALNNSLLIGTSTHLNHLHGEDARNCILNCRYRYQLMCVWASWELVAGRERRALRSQSVGTTQSAGSIESDQSYFTQVLNQRVQEQAESGELPDEFDILLCNTLVHETPPPVASPTRR